MGLVVLNFRGSFKDQENVTFSALDHGHTHAIQEAIDYLKDTAIKIAYEQDIKLGCKGEEPREGFPSCMESAIKERMKSAYIAASKGE